MIWSQRTTVQWARSKLLLPRKGEEETVALFFDFNFPATAERFVNGHQ